MPAAEIDATADVVRRLLAAQHPDLAELPIAEPVNGWDNATFRLGDDLAVRLPRRTAAAALIVNEQRWLPALAPTLPVPVPTPVRVGTPGCGYPWSWTVVPYVAGRPLTGRSSGEPAAQYPMLATELGAFFAALHRPGPPEAPRNPHRGVPLAEKSELTEARLHRLVDFLPDDLTASDSARLRHIWRQAAALPAWSGPPLWLHGDTHPLNLLGHRGHLAAVIDFGDITTGDPACDLGVAWALFGHDERNLFRRAAANDHNPIDDDTWARARAWAVTLSLAILANSSDNPTMHQIGRTTLVTVLEDDRGSRGSGAGNPTGNPTGNTADTRPGRQRAARTSATSEAR